MLEKAGYEVEIISNGNRILKNQYTIPHLFILDKQLSGVDGLYICRFLKQQERTSRIPVIMISANPGIKGMAASAGADDVIEKPFAKRDFIKTVEDCLNKEYQ
jgi:DNA-binding response OmpR family regulator